VPYGMEECDLSLQLFAAGWQIYETGDLLPRHRAQAPSVAGDYFGVIANVGLFAFLHYPISAFGWGTVQVANKVIYCIGKGRIRGVVSGILSIPGECYKIRQYRKPVARLMLNRFWYLRKKNWRKSESNR
jgi:hypothetical protein